MSSSHLPSTQSKSWWSRNKPSKPPSQSQLRPSRSFSGTVDTDEKFTSPALHESAKSKDNAAGTRFKTFGSAIGFKSRKVPALTIQDPPSLASGQRSPVHGPYTDAGAHSAISAPSHYENGPNVSSVSTAQCVEYDGDAKSATASEPRTPSDNTRASYQHSVLTISELDPFHATGVVIQHATHDPSRLSAYSDSSILNSKSQKDLALYNRISYASSSSNSHGHSSDSHSGRLMSPGLPMRARVLSDSSDYFQHNRSTKDALPLPESRTSRRHQTPSGSNSSTSTIMSGDPQNRLSDPPIGTTHMMHQRGHVVTVRQRGMTIATAEGGSSRSEGNRRRGESKPSLPPIMPLQMQRKVSDFLHSSQSPSSSNAPSPSPVIFNRSRSSTVTSTDSPISPSATRPLVVVRKASSTRMQRPPPISAPPSAQLPPPPPPPLSPSLSAYADTLDEISISAFPDPPSSSSSSMSFAPGMDSEGEQYAGDMIHQFLQHAHLKGKRGKRRAKGSGTPSRSEKNLSREQDTSRGSISSFTRSALSPNVRGDTSEDGTGYSSGSASARLLRKAASQQSLGGKRFSETSLASSVASGSTSPDDAQYSASMSPSSKLPRKQRSFHHSRLPLPPLPTLRHAGSLTGGPAEHSSSYPVTVSPEQHRRSSLTTSGPPPTRKRLFSGSSSRKSTSSQAPLSPQLSPDDDSRSIYSVEDMRSAGQKIVMTFGNLGGPLSLLTSNACVAPSSYLSDSAGGASDDMVVEEKRASQAEYTPQHIMPPADMLRWEQQLLADEAAAQDSDNRSVKLGLRIGDMGDAFIGGRRKSDAKSSKPRVPSRLSTISAGTLAFGPESPEPSDSRGMGIPPSPVSPLRGSLQRSPVGSGQGRGGPTDLSRTPGRSTSVLGHSLSKPALSLFVRPSTAQPSLPSPSASAFHSTHSPEQPTVSLPPPPRSRMPRQKGPVDKRSSVVPLHPLSPPPVHSKGRMHAAGREHPSQASHPPSAFDQKTFHHRSIIKKPSFLDIDDEFDVTAESVSEVEVDPPPSMPPLESSFLDMDRGTDSFDTVRSSDSLYI